jgi:rfaE bifunctional protein kinase chain/domain
MRMDRPYLEALLAKFSEVTVAIIGDFFLDQYLFLDRRLSEPSLETGLEAYQVVEIKSLPGAAGTVAANLRALGVNVLALGVLGDDGAGFDLKRGLARLGVDASRLLVSPHRFTPVYLKPMMREVDGTAHELNRVDTKNRDPMPEAVEAELLAALARALPRVQAVIIADQVSEANCGVITERLRTALGALAARHPDIVFIADSRENIGRFENVLLKPNAREAVRAVVSHGDPEEVSTVEACGMALAVQTGRPVFVTLGPGGILLCESHGHERIDTLAATGPIDPVGAGDSVMAGLVAALCAGATLPEAALVGNLVASITVEQLGTTGTASPAQLLARFDSFTDHTTLA